MEANLTKGDRVRVRREPRGPGSTDDHGSMVGTVVRVVDPGPGHSAGSRKATVQWENGETSRHSLGMLDKEAT